MLGLSDTYYVKNASAKRQRQEDLPTQIRSTAKRELGGAALPVRHSTSGAVVPQSRNRPQSLDQKKSSKGWIGLLLFLVAIGLVYASFKSEKTKNSQQGNLNVQDQAAGGIGSHAVDSIVNRHLKMTHQQLEVQRTRTQLENLRTVPSVGDRLVPYEKPEIEGGVDLSLDRNELNAARDLRRKTDYNANSPHHEIQSDMANVESMNQYSEDYKRQYIEQFIANARAGGYEIEVDDDFVVTKVKKIKPEQQFNVFPGSGTGAR